MIAVADWMRAFDRMTQPEIADTFTELIQASDEVFDAAVSGFNESGKGR